MTEQTPVSTPAEIQAQVCYKHPDRETYLRCNRCERPMCNQCAVLTPTGYRCKECVSGQQKTFETAKNLDYVWAIVLPLVLSLIGSYIASLLQFFTIFIAPIVGVIIAEAVRWAVKRRRSRMLFRLTAGAAAVGSLPLLVLTLISSLFLLSQGVVSFYSILPILWQVLYAFLVTSSAYYRLSGIQIR
ncbi:B-box zinc finger protein [Levilinea saccharolytica]|jgi:hypothetical protein|uniref:B box-type domain-containing protein n=1 Tax=Levilinea saccharolytica TaxID=229921 RepID=A0A0N8GNN5_9CHLR|nr:hypothetical protein [Levilinea saccharolytica]KPL78594.1 hypothetical protein ADN01_14605 [Levilinea saccharolytica]GAP16214.1 B-box zinc finger [Levilinea saccharolytica]